MAVRIKAGSKNVEIPTKGTGYPSIDKYWVQEENLVRISQHEYNDNEKFQDDMLELLQKTQMTDHGRMQWVLSAEPNGVETYLVLLHVSCVNPRII